MKKTCIACGYPMRSSEDYPLKDMSKNYCVHCSNPDGSMFSYEQEVKALTDLIVETQGIIKTKAKEIALVRMENLPAWKNKFCK